MSFKNGRVKKMKRLNRWIGMTLFLLLGAIAILSYSEVTAEDSDILVSDAIDQGLITTETMSSGSASGHIGNMLITSNSDEAITLSLSPSGLEGMVLENPNEDEQPEGISDTPGVSVDDTSYTPQDNVTINPGENVTIPIIGFCMDFTKDNPTNGTTFTLNVTSEKPAGFSNFLEVIANFTYPDNFTADQIVKLNQAAYWITTDPTITHQDLADRGYTIADDEVQSVKDILVETGMDPTTVANLPSLKKQEIEPEEDEDDGIPWDYIAAGIIILAIAGYAVSRRTKPSDAGKLPELVGGQVDAAIKGDFPKDRCNAGLIDFDCPNVGSSFDCTSTFGGCQDHTFACAGGTFDDFECGVNFDCPTTFNCTVSFDAEDCEGTFTCSGRFSGYL